VAISECVVEVQFAGAVFEWRGPAPFYFVALTADAADDVSAIAATASYGWGCVPVTATVGETTWTTSLIPKDGGYLLPLRKRVREIEAIVLDAQVSVELVI
jgi:hypothetical protein